MLPADGLHVDAACLQPQWRPGDMPSTFPTWKRFDWFWWLALENTLHAALPDDIPWIYTYLYLWLQHSNIAFPTNTQLMLSKITLAKLTLTRKKITASRGHCYEGPTARRNGTTRRSHEQKPRWRRIVLWICQKDRRFTLPLVPKGWRLKNSLFQKKKIEEQNRWIQ
jgi:hypothetical protein